MKAPFPWFGGKSRAASTAWAAMGDPVNYVEPFGGSAAVLLARPSAGKVETYNDLDGYLVNFWRAVQRYPDEVARWADWPVSEVDLHARHAWLVQQSQWLRTALERDPLFCNPQIAGWWVWGACAWIGSGWCSGRGPWRVDPHRGFIRGDAGRGINRQLPHLGDAGQGINRQLPHLGDAGRGITEMLQGLAARLRRVRVTCGPFRRVCTPVVVERNGLSAVFMDPPYTEGWDIDRAYSAQDGSAMALWDEVVEVSLDLTSRGVRVVLCGYSGMWEPPSDWTERPWVARKGYAADRARQDREVLWCNQHCVAPREMSLFGASE